MTGFEFSVLEEFSEMFKLLTLLLVSLVAGNGFQVPRPWMLGRPAFRMDSSPANVFYQPKLTSLCLKILTTLSWVLTSIYFSNFSITSVQFKQQEQSAQDWPFGPVEPRTSNSNDDGIPSNRKFFFGLFDNNDNEQGINTIMSPYNLFDPFNLFAHYYQNNPPSQNRPLSALTRPAFALRTVSVVMTVTTTVVTPLVTLCISSNMFATLTNATSCAVVNTRRRSIEEDFPHNFSPSLVDKK